MSMTDTEECPVLPPQQVVVTGGAGYIGSRLVASLAAGGHQVCVLDDLSTGRAARLAGQAGPVRLVTGSILDADLVEREVKNAGTVFHLAAAVGVRRIIDDPLQSLRTNLAGTENVLRACAEHGCRVVLASSSEVYGKLAGPAMAEAGDRLLGPTTVPRWSYAAAKAVDEHLAFAYRGQGLRVSVVRYFNCYGPGLDRTGDASVVAVFVRHALAGQPIPVHGDGRQTRCLTYVSDTVRGTLLAAAVPQAEGQVFNIGSTTETSIAGLAALIAGAAGTGAPVELTPYPYGARFEDVRRRVPDIRLARSVLGWEPRVSLPDGIQRTIAWWRTRGDR
jgi:nucleoside-diphosphate-sugar epimerase